MTRLWPQVLDLTYSRKKVCLLPAARQFRNLIYYWVRDLMFFTSSSSLSGFIGPSCPLMSTWYQRFLAGSPSSRPLLPDYQRLLVAREAISPWLSLLIAYC